MTKTCHCYLLPICRVYLKYVFGNFRQFLMSWVSYMCMYYTTTVNSVTLRFSTMHVYVGIKVGSFPHVRICTSGEPGLGGVTTALFTCTSWL